MSEPTATIGTMPVAPRLISFIYLDQASRPLPAVGRIGLLGLEMKRIRVLIVDRNPEVRRALAARLGSSQGIEVLTTARGASEAFPLISALAPEVVLLDSRSLGELPQAHEIVEPVRALRRLGPRIIVLATYSDERERRAFLQAGADRYLLKDIDSASLIAAIGSGPVERPAPSESG